MDTRISALPSPDKGATRKRPNVLLPPHKQMRWTLVHSIY